jgi:hypothetical protein
LVGEIRGIFGYGWKYYELIQADMMKFVDGRYKFKVPKLMGTRNQFERVEKTTLTPMETGNHYLLAEGTGTGLKLLPFVKVMASPSNMANACYFYNRT